MTFELFNSANFAFNPYAVPTALTALLIIGLGLIVFIGERNSRVSLSFLIMTLTAAIWLLSYSLMYCAITATVAAQWARIGQLGVTFIPASVYHFTVGTRQTWPKHRSLVWLSWLISGAFFLIALLTNLFLTGVYPYWWGFYAQYGWLSIPFLGFFFGLMALSLRHYWFEYHSATAGIAKERSKALFIAFCVAYLGSIDYLPTLGVSIYPIGYLALLGFIVLAARAVWLYRLVDITPAFAAEEIINAMTDALLVLDNDGLVRVANRAACQLFDESERGLLGTPIRTLTLSLAPPEATLDRLILTGSLREFATTLPSPTRDGITTVSTSSFAMRDEESRTMAIVCIFHDITMQMKAQQEIQRHTKRQIALYDINVATTSTLDLRAVLDVLLEKLNQLVPQSATTIMLLSDNERDLVKVAARNVDEDAWRLEPEQDDFGNTHPVLQRKDAVLVSNLQTDRAGLCSAFFCKNGYVSYLGVPLIIKNKAIGILSFYTSKEQHFTEEEVNFFKTLAGQAAAAISNSQLFEQMRKQALALEKANRVKDEFLSVMSHELRTPLNVIAGYTKIVQDGMLGEINAEQIKALDKVSRHSYELLVMVNSIMDATKIEAGAVVIECEEFPLSEFLDEMKFLYEYPLGKDLTLEWDYPPNLPTLRTDRDKLKHILQNLINNALKFTDAGRITVSVHEIRNKDRIEFSITDTGIGIPATELPNVFDRFRQVNASRTRSHGGVGLGLHIVKTFTQVLGGTVQATSELGTGSTFTVTLPRAYEGAGAVRTTIAQPSDSPEKPGI